METMARTLGFVCLLSALVGCAETQTGAAHATTAAALSEADATDKKPVVRLRMEVASDPVQELAFLVVRRSLVEQGFVVSSGFTDGFDADLLIRSASPGGGGGGGGSGSGTHVSLVAKLGARLMLPVTVDLAVTGHDEADVEALSDLAMRWQRRFSRSPRLDRHLEPDMVTVSASVTAARTSPGLLP